MGVPSGVVPGRNLKPLSTHCTSHALLCRSNGYRPLVDCERVLAIPYYCAQRPQGTADGIARFYKEVMNAPSKAQSGRATVSVGRNQHLHFTETSRPLPEYDNHHIQVYIADFGTPYHWLKEHDLITMETDADEWRFQWIVDPRDEKKLFQIEHEVRSLKHRLFARPLVKRNHSVTNMTYLPGHDAFRGTY